MCPNAVLKCVNTGCSQEVKRCNMPSHLEVCPKQVVDCSFKGMGCSFTSKRKKKSEHVQNEISSHVQLVTQRVKHCHPTAPAGAVVKVKCIIFDGAANIPVFTDSFYSGRGGYQLIFQMCRNNSGHVGVYTSVYCLVQMMMHYSFQ